MAKMPKEETQFDRVAIFFWVAVSLPFKIKWTLIWREEAFCNLKDAYVDISVTFKKCWQTDELMGTLLEVLFEKQH